MTVFFSYFQVVVFQHMYWVTLAVVYITVQSTISIFNFGFILWCFFFLWHGQALYLQPRTRLFRLWKIFIGYNYFTLLAKVCLQVGEQNDLKFFNYTTWSVSDRGISNNYDEVFNFCYGPLVLLPERPSCVVNSNCIQ